ncbi:MAG: tetratricopeptide repeat protein [Planctomycetota bacterium]|jgi:tetratricopeptide (TPR) repeat protein
MNTRLSVLPVIVLGWFLVVEAGFAEEDPLSRARAHLARGEFTEALEAADEAVAGNAENAEAHATRADALGGLGRWDDAVAAYEEALRLLPEKEDTKERCVQGVSRALLRIAEGKIDSGEMADALDTLNDALIWDIDFIEALLRRVDVLDMLGQGEEAEDELRTALLKAPRDPRVLHLGALFYARSRRFDEALPLLDRLLAGTSPPADPWTLAWAHLTTGKIHLEEGERGRGYRHVRRAVELAPENEQARSILANLEGFREQAERITRAENALLLASLATLLVYGGLGFAGWRVLKRKGWV